jgi:hypothetical protein
MQMTRSEYESLPSWLSVFTKDFQVGDRFRRDTVPSTPMVILVKESKSSKYRLDIEAQKVQLVE